MNICHGGKIKIGQYSHNGRLVRNIGLPTRGFGLGRYTTQAPVSQWVSTEVGQWWDPWFHGEYRISV